MNWGDLIPWEKPILKKSWIIWFPLRYFNFKSLKDPNSSSFIRFQCILLNTEVLFSHFWNFYKLKRGDLISGGNQFCRYSEVFGPPLLYFNFKTFKDPNSSSFIRLQWVLYNSVELLSDFWNCHKLNRGGKFLGDSQFCRKSKLFGLPFCISILKLSKTEILCHLLDFNAFCMIQKSFCGTYEISRN